MPRHWSEEAAKDYLESLGYTILAQNYRIRGAEIDLVARDHNTIVFIEIKQRKSSRYGSPAEAIGAGKIRRLRLGALHYLLVRYGHDDLPVRFDAVLVEGSPHRYRLTHLVSAF